MNNHLENVMSKSPEKVIPGKTKRKPDENIAPSAQQAKNSSPEACAEDTLMCPCFPHINIEDHITGKSELTK
jgi:hypothetical protein